MWNVISAGISHPGRVRTNNEDHWAADPTAGLYTVSDGMGGHVAGELASQIVVQLLPALLRQRMNEAPAPAGQAERARVEWLKSALCSLSGHVHRHAQKEPTLAGMGSTVVTAWIDGPAAVIGHLGDSRAYHYRNGRLEQLTHDHSVVQVLIDSGEITPEQALDHPASHCLTRNVGMAGEPLPEVRLIELRDEDVLLLCTDGLSGMVGDPSLAAILERASTPAAACEQLVDAANAAGGQDNITAVVLRIVDGTRSGVR